jgi:hypothetical protein
MFNYILNKFKMVKIVNPLMNKDQLMDKWIQ